MKIVVAPDSFKECLPSWEVASVISEALLREDPSLQVVQIPMADGGEGTLEVLSKAIGAEICRVTVSDPLGRPVQAGFGLKGDTAVIEVAQACGLTLLSPEERNPLEASSMGVGQLITAAYEAGCRHFLVGLGGSATCDGGEGMLSVPGIKDMLRNSDVEVLSDVDAPFTGQSGAARVFAPQKGASPREVEILEERMTALAGKMLLETGVDVTRMPGAGAAGGLGGALMAYAGAKAVSGVQRVLDLTGFDSLAAGASLVITGEGRSDAQTLQGKVPYGVLRRSGMMRVALLSGSISDRKELKEAGFGLLIPVTPPDVPLSEALKPEVAARLLGEAALRAFRTPSL